MNRHGHGVVRFILVAIVAAATGATGLASADTLFTATGSLQTPRDSHTATRLANGSVVVAGGTNWDGTLGSAEIYNPATGQFAGSVSSMRSPRSLHTATLLQNGKVLFVGGLGADGFTPVADVELYNPANDTFSHVAWLSVGRYY